ncbi:MAG: hypothetical protein OEZ43_06610 [Gammaproteobacteria bacterium]|nr:hypothetical protein [Gammaproteobacteria bacterium]
MRKLYSWVLVLLVVFSCAKVSALEKKLEENKIVSVLNKRPFFTLRIECENAIFQVVVNGVNVMESFDGSQFNTVVPVNQYMTSGENRIELYSDTTLENSSIKIILRVASKDESDKVWPVATLVASAKGNSIKQPALGSSSDTILNSARDFFQDDKGDVHIGKLEIKSVPEDEKSLHFVQTITMQSSLPRWKFLDSKAIKYVDDLPEDEYQKLHRQLYPKYRFIQEAITSNRINEILPLFKERNEELDAAFYADKGTFENRLKASLENTATDKDLEALNLREQSVGLNSSYTGKLVWLERDDAPAIVFNYRVARGSISYEIQFRREGDDWVISR